MLEKKYILWLGAVFNDDAVFKIDAISPAGNKWQLKFIKSIIDNDIFDVVCLGHRPERAFPRGRIFTGSENNFNAEGINQILVPYLNLPFIRNVFININLLIKLLILLIRKGRPEFIVSYNIYSYNALIPLICKSIFNIKWVYILADPINDKTDKYNGLNKLADGHLFLSDGEYHKSLYKYKIHIDGGIDNINVENTSCKQPYLLYSGRISAHNGIELLIDAFELVNKDVVLKICGKGDNKRLNESVKQNPRIHNMGTVNEEDLHNLVRQASVLINPRLIQNKTNQSIFPSKLLEYLSYKKPIISTKTSGVSNDYEEVIEFVNSDDPTELASKINNVLNWSEAEINARVVGIENFIDNKKSWKIMASKFIDWIQKID